MAYPFYVRFIQIEAATKQAGSRYDATLSFAILKNCLPLEKR
ncbi:hypothetical protein [Acidovorax sp. 1608163]|nr:hypothetical protein [Acidovorax sp. 1608163]